MNPTTTASQTKTIQTKPTQSKSKSVMPAHAAGTAKRD